MNLLCPTCQTPVAVPDEWAGQLARCPACRAEFRSPGGGDAEGEASPAPVAAPPEAREAEEGAPPPPPAPPSGAEEAPPPPPAFGPRDDWSPPLDPDGNPYGPLNPMPGALGGLFGGGVLQEFAPPLPERPDPDLSMLVGPPEPPGLPGRGASGADPLTLACPNGHPLATTRDYAGQLMACPVCGARFVVPSADDIPEFMPAPPAPEVADAPEPPEPPDSPEPPPPPEDAGGPGRAGPGAFDDWGDARQAWADYEEALAAGYERQVPPPPPPDGPPAAEGGGPPPLPGWYEAVRSLSPEQAAEALEEARGREEELLRQTGPPPAYGEAGAGRRRAARGRLGRRALGSLGSAGAAFAGAAALGRDLYGALAPDSDEERQAAGLMQPDGEQGQAAAELRAIRELLEVYVREHANDGASTMERNRGEESDREEDRQAQADQRQQAGGQGASAPVAGGRDAQSLLGGLLNAMRGRPSLPAAGPPGAPPPVGGGGGGGGGGGPDITTMLLRLLTRGAGS